MAPRKPHSLHSSPASRKQSEFSLGDSGDDREAPVWKAVMATCHGLVSTRALVEKRSALMAYALMLTAPYALTGYTCLCCIAAS